MAWRKNGTSSFQPDRLNTILGRGSIINGKVKIENSVRLDGKLIGELRSSGTVTISSQADVDGDIYAKSAIIGGKVKGRIQTTEQIILESQSVFIGDLKTSKLTISEGAMFEGNCLMVHEEVPAKTQQAEQSPSN